MAYLLYTFLTLDFCVSGGAFPPPPAVANLLSLLPPPNCFRGPFVKLEALVDLFMRLNLPEQGGCCKCYCMLLLLRLSHY